jgi:pyridoxamine 5'-phosphate oxidase
MAMSSNAADWPSAGIDEDTLAADPNEMFERWMADVVAAGLPEPAAMVLATVSGAGQPRARTVLLRGHDAAGLTFFTNRTSKKGADLAEVPRACLLFAWHAIHRQVIIEGPVVEVSAAASDEYFHTRPRGSQLAAWASRQSTVVGSRAELEQRYADLERRWPEGTEVPAPPFWGGYRLEPTSFEFWHGRAYRMHDRLRYRRSGPDSGLDAEKVWVVERLAP